MQLARCTRYSSKTAVQKRTILVSEELARLAAVMPSPLGLVRSLHDCLHYPSDTEFGYEIAQWIFSKKCF